MKAAHEQCELASQLFNARPNGEHFSLETRSVKNLQVISNLIKWFIEILRERKFHKFSPFFDIKTDSELTTVLVIFSLFLPLCSISAKIDKQSHRQHAMYLLRSPINRLRSCEFRSSTFFFFSACVLSALSSTHKDNFHVKWRLRECDSVIALKNDSLMKFLSLR